MLYKHLLCLEVNGAMRHKFGNKGAASRYGILRESRKLIKENLLIKVPVEEAF